MDIKRAKKYNVSGPRYTSYPTALQFKEAFNPSSYQRYIKERNEQSRSISLYFHIPFCFSLCWYCGCTKVITRDKSRAEVYLEYMEREMDQLLPLLNSENEVVQIHFGGGTPTFLSPDQIRQVGTMIRSRFKVADHSENSIEIDPRRLTYDHVKAMREAGLNRASIGIQDTNRQVQEAVHRLQPHETNKQVVRWLREQGFSSINVDLIYGLPRQTKDLFRQTLQDVLELTPDRLAIYSYAHVPWIKPSQKLIQVEELPTTDQKLQMMNMAVERLTSRGYRYIGLDHFAREGDELVRAYETDTLQRNFQGYSTHAQTDLYAFGMSGISQVGSLYYQNLKQLKHYYERLNTDRWPIFKTYWLSQDDRIRKAIIMQIMCKNFVYFTPFEQQWGIRVPDYFSDELDDLQRFEADGLVRIFDGGFKVTEEGRFFVRNIAMVFDRYLNEMRRENRFSKTV